MLAFTRHRAIGIVTVTVLAATCPEPVFLALFASAALGHYALSFLYSRRPATRLWNQPDARLPVALLGLLGVAIVLWDFPVESHPLILLYFGIHHVLSEVYLGRAGVGRELRSRGLVASRFAFNLLVYVFLIRYRDWATLIPSAVLWAGMALAGGAVLFYLYRFRGAVSRETILDHLLFEMLGLVMVAVSLFVQVTFIQIIFYHVVVWFMVPLGMLRIRGGVGTYLVRTAVVTGGLLALTPLLGFPWQFSTGQMLDQVFLWGYIHITASFALSSLNPGWIRTWFQARPSAVQANSA